jgi:UDP-N-acetylglucosamine 2-epimerase
VALEFKELEVSSHIEAKINSLHGVTTDDVLDSLESEINSEWDDDPERGLRLYVWGHASQRVIFVCLWPIDVDSGVWRLMTAYPDTWP